MDKSSVSDPGSSSPPPTPYSALGKQVTITITIIIISIYYIIILLYIILIITIIAIFIIKGPTFGETTWGGGLDTD